MHLIVNEWEIGSSWSLSDSTEFIVDGSVTEADPTLVGSEIWHWNTSQMGANGRAAKHGRVTGLRDGSLRLLIELGGGWEGIGLIDFRLC